MSTSKKLLGLWIVFFLFVFVYPGIYYLLSKSLDALLGLSRITLSNANLFAAAIASGLGLFWATWAYSYLHFVGKGSPLEAFGVALYPTQNLVTSGPYAYTRNPMVLALILILLAVVFAMGSVSGLVMLPIWTVITAWYIRKFEEAELEQRFGEPYAEYRKSVPELFPRFHK